MIEMAMMVERDLIVEPDAPYAASTPYLHHPASFELSLIFYCALPLAEFTANTCLPVEVIRKRPQKHHQFDGYYTLAVNINGLLVTKRPTPNHATRPNR